MQPHSDTSSKNLALLTLMALGVVYGDIGTSPLYALKETVNGHHVLPLDPLHIYGVLSLLFWTVTIMVSFKYATLMLRADNHGEGGSMALLAKVISLTRNTKMAFLATLLGLFASSLFMGDSIITPAISVLSAVEGIAIVAPTLSNWVIPITLVILFSLFWVQKWGTAKVGVAFGPIMVLWFVSLFVMGLIHVIDHPDILRIVSPHYAYIFIADNPLTAFYAMGTVFLAVTGCEALYADMGHFGKKPIRINWFFLVMPSLLMNYCGQGALLLAEPEKVENPFYLMAPEWFRIPLLFLATAATIIASQAVISGAFSMVRQATLLGYLPRLNLTHTSAEERGQIYIPFINWFLCFAVIVLVITYKSSSNLASMYGMAVVTTMFIDTFLLCAVMLLAWHWKKSWVAAFGGGLIFIYSFFITANALKIPDGGWLPLVMGGVFFFILMTWKKGRERLHQRQSANTMPLELFVNLFDESHIQRVPGVSVFLHSNLEMVPGSLLHNLKHNHVIHETVVVCEVHISEVPVIPVEERLVVENLGKGFYTARLNYGFMQTVNVPLSLRRLKEHDLPFDLMETSFFLSRETLVPKNRGKKSLSLRWRLYFWMHKNSTNAGQFFQIPVNRVVELGSQIDF